jgi:hypothetical protein
MTEEEAQTLPVGALLRDDEDDTYTLFLGWEIMSSKRLPRIPVGAPRPLGRMGKVFTAGAEQGVSEWLSMHKGRFVFRVVPLSKVSIKWVSELSPPPDSTNIFHAYARNQNNQRCCSRCRTGRR